MVFHIKKMLKRTLVISLLIFGFSTSVFSQLISEGSILGNGSAAYKSTSNGGNHSTLFELLPWFGYFVKDNLVLGVGFNYVFSSSQGTVKVYSGNATTPSQVLTVNSVATGLALGPVARYYFNNGFFLNAQYSVGIQRFSTNSFFYTNPSDYNLHVFRGGLGYAFRLSKRILLEPMACYTSQVSTNRITRMESNERGYIFLISFTMLLKLVDK